MTHDCAFPAGRSATASKAARSQRTAHLDNDDNDDVPMEEAQQPTKNIIEAAWEEEQHEGGVLASSSDSEFGEKEERAADPYADEDDEPMQGEEDEDFGNPEHNEEAYVTRLRATVRSFSDLF